MGYDFMKYNLPKGVYELSLRPYSGRLFIAKNRGACVKAYQEIYGGVTSIPDNNGGKFYSGSAKDGMHTFLIWGMDIPRWVHEITHVILELLPKLGFDLNNEACDEAACYLMQAIIADVIKIFPHKNEASRRK